MMSNHSEASSLREQYIEYGFLGDLCKEMWKRGQALDVLRCHTDRNGYDILLEADGIERHVQLKSSFLGAKTSQQTINTKLADKLGGCVVWIRFNPETLKQTEYLWFGGEPRQPLPPLGDRVAKHKKGDSHGFKAKRQRQRVLNKGRFAKIDNIAKLTDTLFGKVLPET